MKKRKGWLLVGATLSLSLLFGCMEMSEADLQQEEKIKNTNNVMKQTKTTKLKRSLERETNDSMSSEEIYMMIDGNFIGPIP